MYRHVAKFDEAYEIKNRFYGDGAEELTLIESLDKYLEANIIEDTGPKCLEIVDVALHNEAIRAIVDCFFNREDEKKYCVWLRGATSSGKSKLIKCMRDIFCCERGDFVRGHLTTF